MTNQQIRDACNELAEFLIRKHENYGRSAEERPCLIPGISPCEAIFVRMSDKCARITALNTGEPDKVGESLDDTVFDLTGYGVLWRVIRKNQLNNDNPSLMSVKQKTASFKDLNNLNLFYGGTWVPPVPDEVQDDRNGLDA